MRKHCTRTKRPLRIPITTGLVSQFRQEMQFAIMTANLGWFSKLSYDKIGGCLNCIYGALIEHPPKDHSVMVVIEGAMRAMNECARRSAKNGVWTLTAMERAAVNAGAIKAEEALQRLDIMSLYNSMNKLKAMQMAEERQAA